MSSPREKAKSLLYTYGIILLGSAILSFGLYNIHERTQVTEGGVLGMTLFLQHWLGLSPAITSPVMDIACYLLAWRFLGNSFARYAVTASLAFAVFHGLWEQFPPLLPNLSAYPVVAAIAGALFVGIGVGLVVREGGASGGDDALALIIAKVARCRISIAYLATDLTVLLLSLSYIPIRRIAWSLLTVTLSSFLIDQVQSFRFPIRKRA